MVKKVVGAQSYLLILVHINHVRCRGVVFVSVSNVLSVMSRDVLVMMSESKFMNKGPWTQQFPNFIGMSDGGCSITVLGLK